MPNEYKSLYMKDVEALIHKTALEIMMSPQKTFIGDQASKVESLNQMNDRVAQFNEGVRGMALSLVKALWKADDDE